TDAELANFKRLSSTGSVDFASTDALRKRIADTLTRLDGLAATRRAIDARTMDRTSAGAAYTEMISTGFLIFHSLATLDDKDLAKDVRTLIPLSKAREVLSQEDSLLSGALASGGISSTERSAFTALVGTQRFLYAEGAAELSPTEAARFQEYTNGAQR